MTLRRRWVAAVGAAGALWAAAALTSPSQERPAELQVLVPPPLPTLTPLRPLPLYVPPE